MREHMIRVSQTVTNRDARKVCMSSRIERVYMINLSQTLMCANSIIFARVCFFLRIMNQLILFAHPKWLLTICARVRYSS